MRKTLMLALVVLVVASCGAPQSLVDFQRVASSQGLVFGMPRFERTPEEVQEVVDFELAMADMMLLGIAEQEPSQVTFDSVFAGMDHALFGVMTTLNRLWLMKETRQEPEVRQTCTAQVQKISEWLVSVQYREDLYNICQAYVQRLENGLVLPLEGEDKMLYLETMRDYRRAGFSLDAATRGKVAKLKNTLSRLESEFDTNITDASVVLEFSKEDLKGVPEEFLQSSLTAAGRHVVRATVTPDYMAVMENAFLEETRRRLNTARYSVAMAENGPLLNKLVSVRRQIASLLGYETWADYQIEPKMAGTSRRAIGFAEELAEGLAPKFEKEVEVLRQLKVQETGNKTAVIHWWDFRYYQNKMMREQFAVDSSELRNFFVLENVLAGMFDVYQRIFGLRFTKLEPEWAWVDDLQLWAVADAATGEPLGMFFLDLFPRPGKYNHFAQFDVIGGKLLADGRYQRPVAALVCNFTPGVGDAPALMNHGEVETIFHEFGHAMHTILTRAKYSSFSGANVPRDFVEAPSQMFEAWAWDPTVLGSFASDWRDSSRALSLDTIQRMRAADLATQGVHYRRQLGLALSDLRIHVAEAGADAGEICNATNAEMMFDPPAGTNFAAYWGHLTGYDAGYYGYAWADSIAADMATVFEDAPGGFLDEVVGARLRREIYQVGGSRPVEESVRAFLGRDSTPDAFLRQLGIR